MNDNRDNVSMQTNVIKQIINSNQEKAEAPRAIRGEENKENMIQHQQTGSTNWSAERFDLTNLQNILNPAALGAIGGRGEERRNNVQ